MNTTTNAPDLTCRPPRSPRVRLGGYVILPRLLDKCRAELADTSGEYHYNCPLDRRFFDFTGIDSEALKAEVAKGLGDGALLAWVQASAPVKHGEWEIAQWSAFREAAAPADNESRADLNEQIAAAGGGGREDIITWFDYIELDDHVTFGGKA
ncbi:MAG: DUF5069 domain-containing protein [Terrimicrobiaceae bacterium]|nr:DUF5069 domain-containing protein [Terrimicrobiaceae bacterium]